MDVYVFMYVMYVLHSNVCIYARMHICMYVCHAGEAIAFDNWSFWLRGFGMLACYKGRWGPPAL